LVVKTMRTAAWILLVASLGGCARARLDDTPLTTLEGDVDNVAQSDAGGGDGASNAGGDNMSGADASAGPEADGGQDSGGSASPEVCAGSTASCEAAEMLGQIDASDASSTLTQMGTGSGFFAVELRDGNVNATGNTRIGLGATLSAPAGTTYSVTIMGDTSPNGGGRCIAADVSDTDPLRKTAIWGSFGPTAATTRQLVVQVAHESGPCDGQWTLTLTGSPCPALVVGFGEGSLGSCN
jgi:hypothetical protein